AVIDLSANPAWSRNSTGELNLSDEVPGAGLVWGSWAPTRLRCAAVEPAQPLVSNPAAGLPPVFGGEAGGIRLTVIRTERSNMLHAGYSESRSRLQDAAERRRLPGEQGRHRRRHARPR